MNKKITGTWWNEKKYTYGPALGDKVYILTIKGKPIGIITLCWGNHPRTYETSYWARLPNGILIKELTRNEISGI